MPLISHLLREPKTTIDKSMGSSESDLTGLVLKGMKCATSDWIISLKLRIVLVGKSLWRLAILERKLFTNDKMINKETS